MKRTMSSPQHNPRPARLLAFIHKRAERPVLIAAIILFVAVQITRAADSLQSQRPASAPGEAESIESPYEPVWQTVGPAGQYLSPAAPYPIPAIDCVNHCPPGYEATWNALGPVAEFQEYAQGEYVGRARLPHVPTYRLRVDDVLDFVFRVTRNEISGPYEINVGDELKIESSSEQELARNVIVLPDGTITLPFLGQVRAAHLSVPQLRDILEDRYREYIKLPEITVTAVKVDTKLEDLRFTVGGRSGFGGQVRSGKVTPEGTVQLPAVGSVPAQGLTLDVFRAELAARYAEKMKGMEVMPVLTQRAPRFVYVLGEVKLPGRYPLDAPTTVMQAISMAGSWNVGAHIEHIVIFRRAEDWRLIATVLDLRAALLGRRPSPAGEIWVSDADLIIVPKSNILRTDNFIELIFTKGIYGIAPFSGSVSFTNLTTLSH
ncbi:MAG TPA: polysaccharide biosynthesis/export family protein [Pirellulales bacterium]|jgi:polysaccharide export outer membrane protein|nr:polysaccharide biosynthesis/export family protein [Pirellulales bacterium]